MFQCSSASRKFLNRRSPREDAREDEFQCSSASRKFLNHRVDGGKRVRVYVSVLFSEPKIPQFNPLGVLSATFTVSVLFSEPKIPQCFRQTTTDRNTQMFQCSSASRKFLNREDLGAAHQRSKFQCSSASRKFLNFASTRCISLIRRASFSALQRAENSSIFCV